MSVHICAMGRMKAGPEKTLFDDYSNRFNKMARGLGMAPLNLIEVNERKSQSSAAVIEAAPPDAVMVLLDERGTQMSSQGFANRLQNWRDQNQSVAFLIGAADGFGPQDRKNADLLVSFGPMVWPHMLARVMLAEQLYRAASILSGGPYHRA